MEQKQSNLAMIGGVFAAVGASVCCLGPLLLLLLGISGSWIGNLTVAVIAYDDTKTNVEALMKATTNAGYPSTLRR